MYVKRIQLVNYGPIDHLDIAFPFEGDTPKPVLLVGENGSGKSILLSHIVNGLVSAKDVAYPETPEVELGKVYKLRSSSYIKSGSEYYFAKVDFEEGLSVTEMRSQRLKREYETIPTGVSEPSIQDAWNKMNSEQADHFDSNSISNNESRIKDIFSKRCVLYFPPNRFEEPAWLNEDNLKAQAQYMDLKHIQGQTERKVINYSPLRDNQNWLFEVVYDRAAFEMQTRRFPVTFGDADRRVLVTNFQGYSGQASKIYNIVLRVVRTILRRHDVRFGIGTRRNRVVSLMSDSSSGSRQLVPNIFQLSSGETSLLNLFLSTLRDFDLTGTTFSQASDVRGIVVVDEIDLHLHAVHQHEVLPQLIQMFPNVQFVVTTHSPLFVLGMQRVFDEDGFALYRLPLGHRISPEEFSEFGDAYRTFTETAKFSNDMHAAIEGVQKPIVFVEGSTDQKYIHRASQLLGKEALLQQVEMRDGGGSGNLDNVWKLRVLPESMVQERVVLLYDCERGISLEESGSFFRQAVPRQDANPIKKGIENLFRKSALERSRSYKMAFIDVIGEHPKTERGETVTIPEQWTINENEKTNLCDWLCKNGTEKDFQGFQVIFEVLEGLLDLHRDPSGEVEVTENGGPVRGVPEKDGAANP